MSKYLNAKEICEIVLDKKTKLPKELNVTGRKKKEIIPLFGCFETIRSCRTHQQFRMVSPKSYKKIGEMRITEKELLSLLSLWEIWKKFPSRLHFRE